MTLMQRLLRGVTTVGMVGGSMVLVGASLALIRPGLTGLLADVVPNLPMAPIVPVAAAATIVASAWTRRRVLRDSRLPSPRLNEELKPAATQSSVVE